MNIAKHFIVALTLLSAGICRAEAGSHKWNGAFAGADLGVGNDNYNYDDLDMNFTDDRTIYNKTSIVPGVKAGYDWRFGSIVTGLQAEYDANLGAKVAHHTKNGNFDHAANLTSMFAVTGRAGLLSSEQGLLYLRFGGVFARDYQEIATPNGFVVGDWRRNSWIWGMLAGVGGEFAVNDRVSLTGEFLHGYFAPKAVTVSDNSGDSISYGLSPSLDVFRAGVNYRF